MPSKLTLGDAIYIYERLGEIAHELQRTRSSGRMVISGFRAVLTAAHIPVGLQTQDLNYQQLEKKAFYEAVTAGRNALTRKYSGSRFVNTNWAIDEDDAKEMMRLANYVLSGNDSAATGLADMKKVRIRKEQIRSRLFERICPNVDLWAPDWDELKELDKQYQEGR